MASTELLADVRGLRNGTGESFKRELVLLSQRLGLNPSYIASVMSFETGGTFRSDIRNPASKFVGLIQFGPQAAAMLGTTTDALAQMTPVQQLAYVEKYFARVKSSVHTLADYYLAVFAPSGIGKSRDFALYAQPSKAYDQNKGLDKGGDGVITVADAVAPVENIYAAAQNKPPIVVDMVAGMGATDYHGAAKGGLLFGAMVAVLTLLGWKKRMP